MDYEQILRYAMEMELRGSEFFRENAGKFNNPTSKKLFLDLAETEMEHYRYLKNQLNNYLEANKFDLSEEALNREEDIFKDREDSEKIKYTLDQSDIPDLTILRMAYLIEKDFKEYYTEAMENAQDEGARKIFEKLAKWEAGHEKLFKHEYDRRMKEYMEFPWGG